MSRGAVSPGLPPSSSVLEDWVARAVFDFALDGFAVLDRSGALLACNERYLSLWNFPPEILADRDVVKMRAHIAQQLADASRYLGSIEALTHTDQPAVFDELALKDGRVFERQISSVVLPGNRGGQVFRWRDISARRRAEQALAQSQARLSAVVEHALNAIMLASDDGRYVDVNPAACELTGYSRDELLALPISELVVPESVDIDTVWKGFLQAGTSRGRVKLRHKDGSIIVAAFNAKAQILPGLNLSILSDVTDEAQTQQRLESLAQSDPLTGISNRRHFLSVAEGELARAQRHGQALALLMIDLDHFKAINDTYGHAAGDEVLRSFAKLVAGEIRQGEYFARLGGEEFAILLPHTGLEGAAAFAQRLSQKVREHPATPAGQVVHFTACFGVAALAPGAATAISIDELMKLADGALYRGKATGRDRVEVSGEIP